MIVLLHASRPDRSSARSRGTRTKLRGIFADGGPAGMARSGVADRLLRSIERELSHLGDTTLDTTAPLRRAMSFYNRNSYVASGTTADFFGMALFQYRKRI